MAGGRGDHGGLRGQVPMEEAPHRDRSIEDAMLIEDLQRQIVELTLLLQRNLLLEVADRNQDRRMRHGSSRSKTRMSRDCRPRHESASYTDFSSHHRHHNIFSDNVSPSPHPQQRDNHSKDCNSLHCGAKAEIFNGEDEEIDPFNYNNSLVSCDEEALHLHNNKMNSREAKDHETDSDSTFDNPFQNCTGTDYSVFEVAGIFVSENMSFESQPIYDEYPDDEDDTISNLEELRTEIESFENDLLGDLPVSSIFPSNTTTTSTKEVCSLSTTNVDLQQFQQKTCCLINIEVSRYEYEDPFLKPRSETENARFVLNKTLRFGTIFGHELLQQNFKMTQENPHAKLKKFNFTKLVLAEYTLLDKTTKSDPIDLMVLDLKLYCLKEIYKDIKKKIRTRGRVLFNPERLMQEHPNQKLNFSKQNQQNIYLV